MDADMEWILAIIIGIVIIYWLYIKFINKAKQIVAKIEKWEKYAETLTLEQAKNEFEKADADAGLKFLQKYYFRHCPSDVTSAVVDDALEKVVALKVRIQELEGLPCDFTFRHLFRMEYNKDLRDRVTFITKFYR